MASISTRGLMGAAGHWTTPISALAFTAYSAKHRIDKGENPLKAYAAETIAQAPWFLLSMPAALLVSAAPALPAVASAAVASWDSRTKYLRNSGEAFSNRFEHTDATARSMSAGLSAISDSRSGLGQLRGVLSTQAASMAKRYLR